MKKLIIFTTLVLALPAFAYILPGDFIIGMFADWRKDLKIEGLEIKSEWTIYPKNLQPVKYNATEYMRSPYEWRVELSGENDSSVFIWRGIKKFTKTSGDTNWKKEKTKLPLEVILFANSLEIKAVKSEIKKFGVDIEKRRLGRFDEKIGYVVGTEKRDEKIPEIWFQLKSFKPIRYVDYIEKDGKLKKIDIRYEDYSSSVSGEWYPRLIEKYIDDKLVERREIISISLNPKLKQDLFKAE